MSEICRRLLIVFSECSCVSSRIPEDCSRDVAELIQSCCGDAKGARPTAEEVVRFLALRLEFNNKHGLKRV